MAIGVNGSPCCADFGFSKLDELHELDIWKLLRHLEPNSPHRTRPQAMASQQQGGQLQFRTIRFDAKLLESS